MKLPFFALFIAISLASHASGEVFRLSSWGIPAGDYSGIVPIGNDEYAVVSDDNRRAGFFVWHLAFDKASGKLTSAENRGFRGTDFPIDRDAEGIAFCPGRNSVFISGEQDQRVLEHRLDGSLTGSGLHVPEEMGIRNIQPNRGFEALTFDAGRNLFWTVTESHLKSDAPRHLRLTSFGLDMEPCGTYDYILDDEMAKNHGRDHYHGLVALAVLPGGDLLALEREVVITKRYNRSRCWCKLYRFNPNGGNKALVHEWDTVFSLTSQHFANYEGMCLGPQLEDGRQTLLLVSDSQSGFGKAMWHLHDYLKVVIL